MGQAEREDPAPLTANVGLMPPPSLLLCLPFCRAGDRLFPRALPGSALPACQLLLSQLHPVRVCHPGVAVLVPALLMAAVQMVRNQDFGGNPQSSPLPSFSGAFPTPSLS